MLGQIDSRSWPNRRHPTTPRRSHRAPFKRTAFHDPDRKASCRCSHSPVASRKSTMPILIPARNSRHRTACFALYRALLRSARDIQVSVDHVPERVNDPIRWLIRGQFRRNRKDVSPRLVYSSLSAGYKVRSHSLPAQALFTRGAVTNLRGFLVPGPLFQGESKRVSRTRLRRRARTNPPPRPRSLARPPAH